MYIVVSIGNSDDRLTQKEWKYFVDEIDGDMKDAGKVHFFGGASNWMPWQNVAWIVEIEQKDIDKLLGRIERTRAHYRQDSAFVMVGDGLFV